MTTTQKAYNILDVFYQEMLKQGKPYNLVCLTLDVKMIDVFDDSGELNTPETLKASINTCIANEWIHQVCATDTQYSNLQLTTTGFGIAKSKRMQKELQKNTPTLKKVSLCIEEYKGLGILLGFLTSIGFLMWALLQL